MYESLMKALGYTYHDTTLLETALRHRSVGRPNNERLEYLGDSILNFIIANKLFVKFSQANEGQLTRLRAALVNKQSLAEIGFLLSLDKWIELGPGEKKSGGFKRESILADALEAIFASIYLDSGIDSVQQVIDSLYEEKLEECSLKYLTKDPKTKLQEWLQANKKPLPKYSILTSEQNGQESHFLIQCEVDGIPLIQGKGSNRRVAEQQAAEVVLEILDVK